MFYNTLPLYGALLGTTLLGEPLGAAHGVEFGFFASDSIAHVAPCIFGRKGPGETPGACG